MILKDTPDDPATIIANVFRAFLRRENVPEEETESLVSKVKEKKAEEAEKKAEEAERKAGQKIDEAYQLGIRNVIKTCRKLNASKELAIAHVMETYACGREKAEELAERYWND